MRIAFCSAKAYEKQAFEEANVARKHELIWFESPLNAETASIFSGFPAICAFVNDDLNAQVLKALWEGGTRLIALRSAGFNHVDLKTAAELGFVVVRVPAYSPYAVAEHAVALILTLNRKIHRANARVHEGNFALDGLVGFDLHGRTVGIIGTGNIGLVIARIMAGFGCRLLAHDKFERDEFRDLGGRYVGLDRLWPESDILTLHCPLTTETHHLVNREVFQSIKPGAMLINTSRGALIDTPAAIAALKSGRLGYLGLDVYEEEAGLFFFDRSDQVLQDDVFARLLTFPNVLVTGHQAFLTREALAAIASTTLDNVQCFEQGHRSLNEVRL